MAPKPTYFLAPLRPTPPESSIRLGAVIPRPTLPDEPIYLPNLPASSNSPHDVTVFKEKNWSGSQVQTSTTSFGVWASFLQLVVGIGGDGEGEIKKSVKKEWTCEEMTTKAFFPSKAWLEEVVRSEEVREYLVEGRWRDSIYMITGIMTAKSGPVFHEILREKGVHLSIGVEATVLGGVPVSAGPKMGLSRSNAVEEESTRIGEYVFAYRVRKVEVRKKIWEAGDIDVKKSKTVTKGALFHNHNERKTKTDEEPELVGEGLGDEESEEGEGEVATQILEDGEEVECIIMIPEDD
ncbi:hypothetical protein P280DRAFT_471986 [Massarina eburnea CBS 473.64]|uniref:Uncharacterized protein n=1 Tax=Massarina eburnea CBS 473.64 TaxID=1395130 RepID=A0A6A6RU90_9PLEO|nr:hypothetical protein P280DRAFT_471986 [Massarina eburnea CBS 473.64]